MQESFIGEYWISISDSMADLVGLCHICGKKAQKTCKICGRQTCSEHLKGGACISCLMGRK